MLFRLLILAASFVAFSCISELQDTTEYQVETHYGRSGNGLPIQFISFYLED